MVSDACVCNSLLSRVELRYSHHQRLQSQLKHVATLCIILTQSRQGSGFTALPIYNLIFKNIQELKLIGAFPNQNGRESDKEKATFQFKHMVCNVNER